jgi:DNA-binding transcriptional LysR family regulator
MELRLVAYFLKVFEAGSISAASREIHIGQPSLSRQIRKLERDLGVVLFTSGSKASATAAGIAFVPIARDLIARAAQAEANIKAMDHKEAVRLTIAGPPTTVADVIAPFIASSGPEGLLSNIREVLPNAVYRELELYRADLVIGSSPPPSHLEYVVIGYSPIWAQLPEDRKNIDAKEITLAELATYPIAIVDDNHNVRRIFDQAISEAGLSVNIAFETQSTQASQALAAANRAVCISSDDPRFNLHPLFIRQLSKKSALSITLYCAWDSHHFAAELIKDIAVELKKFYEKQNSVVRNLAP